MLWQVHANYTPSPDIIVVSFSYESQTVGILTSDQANRYLAYMAHLATEIGRQGVPQAHVLQLDGKGLNTTGWCATHPDAAAHRQIAEEIVAFIEDTLPVFGNSTFPSALRLPIASQ